MEVGVRNDFCRQDRASSLCPGLALPQSPSSLPGGSSPSPGPGKSECREAWDFSRASSKCPASGLSQQAETTNWGP